MHCVEALEGPSRPASYDCVVTTMRALPAPENVASSYVGHLTYPIASCASNGKPLSLSYTLANGECIAAADGMYQQFTIVGENQVAYKKCTDEACTDCWDSAVVNAGVCMDNEKYVLVLAPVAGPTMFTTPSNPLEPRALAAPASEARDCYAAVGTTILGGWKVTWESKEVTVPRNVHAPAPCACSWQLTISGCVSQ